MQGVGALLNGKAEFSDGPAFPVLASQQLLHERLHIFRIGQGVDYRKQDCYVRFLAYPHAFLPAGMRKRKGIEASNVRPEAIKTMVKPLAGSELT